MVREGLGINPMYLPSLIPHIMNSTKLLPLWSAIIVPIFGFGEETLAQQQLNQVSRNLRI